MSTTLVSALFYIGRDKWSHYSLDQNMYLGWYKNTLSLKSNHVIYTDDYFFNSVKDIVDNYGTSKNIVIIKTSLEELPAYQLHYDRLNTLMSSTDFKKKIPFNVPEALYPLYNIVMFNKVFFLEDAIRRNPFGSEHFIWVDAGGLREHNDNYRGVVWPNREKMDRLDNGKILVFSHHPNIRIQNIKDHSFSQMRFIQGTAFFVDDLGLSKLIPLFNSVVTDCIDSGFIGSDEKVLDLCYLRNPELFQLEVSSWRQYYSMYR